MKDRSEEDIFRKAIQPSRKKGYHRTLPFFTTEQLIDDLTALYPTVNGIFIYNHDLRDQKGGPVLTCKNYRGLKAIITTTKWGRSINHTFDAKWKMCFVAVEDNTAYIKVSQLTVGGV